MDAVEIQWPGEKPRSQSRATIWLKTGATRDAIHGKPKTFWAFDPEGVLVPLPCTTGVVAPQLEVEYVMDGDTITGIHHVSIKTLYYDMGWREADKLFEAEGRADKIAAFESFKQQFARGVNAGLPERYLPAIVPERRRQLAESLNRLDLPALDEETEIEAESDEPKAKRSKQKQTEP